ncbi:MAG: DUF927 domain-containing protein [Bdellovibrionota bacterium]
MKNFFFKGDKFHPFKTKGTLKEWQENIAKFAEGNSRLILCMGAAFATPLLQIIGAENIGFHFQGRSKTGKSTLMICVASIYGNPKEYILKWRSTDNGLEAVASTRNDVLLVIDELGQADGDKLGNLIYMLESGKGKNRANTNADMRTTKKWRTVFISTGEMTLADKINEDSKGKKVRAGMEARFINIAAEVDSTNGVYENLHGFPNQPTLSKHIVESSSKFYGSAIVEYLTKITNDLEYAKEFILENIDKFKKDLCMEKVDGQVLHVANYFAIVASAGELAIKLGVLNLTQNSANIHCEKIFKNWVNEKGGTESFEETEAINQVRKFLQLHASSRFINSKNQLPSTVSNQCGYFLSSTDNTTSNNKLDNKFLFYPEVFRDEVCRGLNHKIVLNTLLKHNFLIPGEIQPNGKYRLDRKEKVPFSGKYQRFYVISEKLKGEYSDAALPED